MSWLWNLTWEVYVVSQWTYKEECKTINMTNEELRELRALWTILSVT